MYETFHTNMMSGSWSSGIKSGTAHRIFVVIMAVIHKRAGQGTRYLNFLVLLRRSHVSWLSNGRWQALWQPLNGRWKAIKALEIFSPPVWLLNNLCSSKDELSKKLRFSETEMSVRSWRLAWSQFCDGRSCLTSKLGGWKNNHRRELMSQLVYLSHD